MNARIPLLPLLLLLLPACGAAGEGATPADPQPARARAALASLYVDNASGEALQISYRLATRATGEVGVGQVPAEGAAAMAPVPAGEPIILIARTTGDTWFVLPARTFAVQEQWTWRIPADARFIPPAATPDQ